MIDEPRNYQEMSATIAGAFYSMNNENDLMAITKTASDTLDTIIHYQRASGYATEWLDTMVEVLTQVQHYKYQPLEQAWDLGDDEADTDKTIKKLVADTWRVHFAQAYEMVQAKMIEATEMEQGLLNNVSLDQGGN